MPVVVVPAVAAVFVPDVEPLVELPPGLTLLLPSGHVSPVVAADPLLVGDTLGRLLGVDTPPV